MDRYQKNYTLFKEKYPYSVFLSSSRDSKGWELCQTGLKQQWNLRKESGGNVYYIHSQEDAEVEGQQWLDHLDLSQTRVLIVYGLGLGYYFSAALVWLAQNPHHKLIFLEDDGSVFHQFLTLDIATSLLEHPQVEIHFIHPFIREETTLKKLGQQIMYRRTDFASLYFYEKHHPKVASQLIYKILFYKNLIERYFDEYLTAGDHYFRNFYRNNPYLPAASRMSGLYGKFKDIPAIICGAGPSLKKNVHLLKGLENKALIFAGGSGMNAVNANNLLPHFGIGIDPFPAQFTRLIMNTAYEVPFIYGNRLNHEAFDVIHGPKLYLNSSTGYQVADWFEKEFHIEDPKIEEGCNVVNLCCSIAKWMGCNPIIIIGTDLAYTEGGSYAPGIKNHAIHDPKQDMITKNPGEEVLLREDIYGKPIFTLWKWVSEAFWYTLFQEKNPGTKIINATEGGIGMESIPNMPLQVAIDQYLTKDYDLIGLLHAEIQKNRMPPQVTKEKIWEYTDSLENSLVSCLAQIEGFAKMNENQSGETPFDWKPLDRALEKELAYTVVLKNLKDRFSEFSEETEAGTPKHIREESSYRRKKFDLQLNYLRQAVRVNLTYIEEARFLNEWESHVSPIEQEESVAIEEPPKNLENYSVHYSNEGKVLSLVPRSEGELHGKAFFYYAEGTRYSIQNFQNGLKEGLQKYFYPDGIIKSLIHYKNDLLDGSVKLYYPSGHLQREIQFKEGKRHGMDRFYFKNGNLNIEAFYEDDLPIGVARVWYSNGHMQKEITYESPGQRSAVREWNPDGSEISPEKVVKEDYFDKVTRQSGKLTEALTNVVGALKDVAEPLDPTKSLAKEMQEISAELARLAELHKEVLEVSGVEDLSGEEKLWKNPTIKHELETHIDQMDSKMQGSFTQINSQLAFLRRLLKDLNPPNPNEKNKP